MSKFLKYLKELFHLSTNLSAIQELSLEKYNLDFKDGLKLAAGLGITYTIYKTVSNILKRRKYQHIPGPPLNG